MTGTYALLGILLVLLAIPFGLMLAPLALGILFVIVAYRGLGRAVGAGDRAVA
jgi:hypothetical protein